MFLKNYSFYLRDQDSNQGHRSTSEIIGWVYVDPFRGDAEDNIRWLQKQKKSFRIARQAFFVLGLKPQKPLPAASRLSPVVNKKRYLENLNVHFVIFVYSVCRVVMGKLIFQSKFEEKKCQIWSYIGGLLAENL